MTIKNRAFKIAGTVVGMATVVFLFQLVACAGAASAQALDPAGAPALDANWSLIEQYGPVWGGMALAFALASYLLKRNESTHWIAKGRTLAIIVAAVGTGSAALAAKFTGTPWSGVLITAVVSLFKLLQPTVTPPVPVPAARDPQAGFSKLDLLMAITLVMIGAAGVMTVVACSKADRSAFAHGMWQCTDPIRADAVAAVTPAVLSVIRAGASADGKVIDLSTVKSAISKANLLSEAGILLSCAAANAFAIMSKPQPTPEAGAPASSELVIDPAAVRDAWSKIDVEMFGGARFNTAAGVQ